jgi:acyl carrier protein
MKLEQNLFQKYRKRLYTKAAELQLSLIFNIARKDMDKCERCQNQVDNESRICKNCIYADRMKQLAVTEKALIQTLKINPGDHPVRFLLSQVYEMEGRLEDAKRECGYVKDIIPEAASMYLHLKQLQTIFPPPQVSTVRNVDTNHPSRSRLQSMSSQDSRSIFDGMPILEVKVLSDGIQTGEVPITADKLSIYPLLNMQVINIGRNPSNDIIIDEPFVSGYHAQIVSEDDQFIFIHPPPQQKRTANGLRYQNRSIPGSELYRKQLEHNDAFFIPGGDKWVILTFKEITNADQVDSAHYSIGVVQSIIKAMGKAFPDIAVSSLISVVYALLAHQDAHQAALQNGIEAAAAMLVTGAGRKLIKPFTAYIQREKSPVKPTPPVYYLEEKTPVKNASRTYIKASDSGKIKRTKTEIDIESRVKRVFLDRFDLEESKIVPEAFLWEDLGLDVFAKALLSDAIQKEFNIQYSVVVTVGMRTVQDVLDTVLMKLVYSLTKRE